MMLCKRANGDRVDPRVRRERLLVAVVGRRRAVCGDCGRRVRRRAAAERHLRRRRRRRRRVPPSTAPRRPTAAPGCIDPEQLAADRAHVRPQQVGPRLAHERAVGREVRARVVQLRRRVVGGGGCRNVNATAVGVGDGGSRVDQRIVARSVPLR
ncbi:MAG: hypothetical protein H6835_19745 [Planctomycetes bacterium]|nr:hypothetical protein [Planctomycetota bacterium]